MLSKVLYGLNAYKNSFAKPINDRYDIVLLGGALGSLFSLCQAIASPVIGVLSDRYGRKPIVLFGLCGVAISSLIFGLATRYWVALLARFIGGALNGNVAVR